jgi:Na+-transporting NADH:ubiquinone oxidoreductase subunit NqrE
MFGKTTDGKDITITINLTLVNMIDKINVLAELNFILRTIIQTFVAAPYVYQWLEMAEAVVNIDGESPFILKGRCFQECTFLEELE